MFERSKARNQLLVPHEELQECPICMGVGVFQELVESTSQFTLKETEEERKIR